MAMILELKDRLEAHRERVAALGEYL